MTALITIVATAEIYTICAYLQDPQTPFRYGKTQYAGLQVSEGAHKWQADFPGSAHCTVYDSAVKTKPNWQKSVGVLGGDGLPCGIYSTH
jgi:hypothetical protein